MANRKGTTMRDPRTIALIGFGCALLLGTAAAQAGEEQTQTQRSERGYTKSRERHIVASIQSIDKDARTVTLVGEDGQTKTIDVPESVKAFNKLTPGQKVNVGYYESLAVDVKKPGEKTAGNQASESTSNTPAGGGQGPGRMAIRKLTMTAEITEVDAKNNKVTLRDAEGKTRTIEVEDPVMRTKLSTVKPGDNVEVTYTEAVAASVVPVSKK
jgi:Cu/Ag efflux protein CusF